MVSYYDYVLKKFIQVDVLNSIKLAHKELAAEVPLDRPLMLTFDDYETLDDKALNLLKNLKYKALPRRGKSVSYVCNAVDRV